MKKLILLLLAIISLSIDAIADGVCATLQHGENMSAYYGADAFKDAYNNATSGDIITLSKGQFNTVSTIKKSVKIIGYYGFSSDATSATKVSSMDIEADSVHVEGIYFSQDVNLGNVKDCIIRRCYISNNLSVLKSCKHINTIIDQCVVYYDYAIGSSENYTIKNSTISCFKASGSSSSKAYILNNVVYYWSYNSRPYAIYKNNILGVSTSNCSTTNYTVSGYTITFGPFKVYDVGEFYNNCFVYLYDYGNSYTTKFKIEFYSSTPNSKNTALSMLEAFSVRDTEKFTYPAGTLNTNVGNGQDGTVKGTYGGSGFTKNPAIPRITSSSISSRTDDEGNLNVTIKVSAQ